MKKTFFLIYVSIISQLSHSQSEQHLPQHKYLTNSESESILNDSLCIQYGIDKPVFKVISYSDNSGRYLTILTRKLLAQYTDKDSANNSIRFLNLKFDHGIYRSTWDYQIDALPDFLQGVQSIDFTNKFIDFVDLNNDSIIDPMIAYSTKTEFILFIFYKNSPSTVRLNYNETTTTRLYIQKNLYQWPLEIQEAVINKLAIYEAASPQLFPKGWRKGMKRKKTKISN